MKLSRLALYAVALFGIAILGAKDSGAAETGDEVRALLEQSASLVEEAGLPGEARKMREQLAVVSNDELYDAYAEVDLEGLLQAQINAIEATASADAIQKRAMAAPPVKRAVQSRRPLQETDIHSIDWDAELGFIDASHPGRAKGERSDGAGSISKWNEIRQLQIDVSTGWQSLNAARDAYLVCTAAGDQIVVAGGIGVCAGGNTSAICVVVAGAITAVQVAFTGLEAALNVMKSMQETTDYLDSSINSAEIDSLVQRSGYLNEQLIAFDNNLTIHGQNVSSELAAHDARVKAQLNQHDLDVKAQLLQHDLDIKEMLTELERQMDLVLKTQIENMISEGGGGRSGVAYQERLQEVCDLAYEAISDASAAGYIVSQTAMERWVEGNSVIDTDPKRAHDYCRSAYQMASARSRRMSGG